MCESGRNSTRTHRRHPDEAMAKALLEFETIDADQINDIMAGKKVRIPTPNLSNGSSTTNKKGSGSGPTVTSPQPSAKSK